MSAITEKIGIFYHVAHMGAHWRKIDREITDVLEVSGLMARADMFVRNDCKHIELFEFPTLNMLRRFSQDEDYYVLYLHTKGVSQPIASVNDWRECMLYWMVERWQECVDKLREGYEAVGCNHIDTPVRHFQGNFWWANTKLIRQLPPVQDVTYVPTYLNQTGRHKAEFWLLGTNPWAYMPYHHRIDPYQTRNPRENYEGLPFACAASS